METFKICSKCKIKKPITHFNKCTSKKDGLYPSCKECRKKFDSENKELISKNNREYREKHKEEINKKSLALYHKNKDKYARARNRYAIENKEKIKEYSRKYYKENKEIIDSLNKQNYIDNKDRYSDIKKKNYEANRGSILERNKKYQNENKEKINIYKKEWAISKNGKLCKKLSNHIRNTKIKIANDNTITKKSLEELLLKQDNKCFYCSCGLDFSVKFSVHLDHYIPIAKGGAHSIENVVFSCKSCNLKKRDIVPDAPLKI